MQEQRYESEISMKDYMANYVDKDYTETMCAECRNYGKNWSCPPFDFDPIAWQAGYERIRIFVWQLTPDADDQEESMREYFQRTREINRWILDEEKKIPGARALSAGACHWCSPQPDAWIQEDVDCARVQDQPCRRPDLMRHSIESVGGLVSKISEGLFDLPLLWGHDGQLPPYFLLVNGLLLPAEAK
jgi:predicted metal-binding protein